MGGLEPPTPALSLLENWKRQPGGEFVFSSPVTKLPFTNINNAWETLRTKAKLRNSVGAGRLRTSCKVLRQKRSHMHFSFRVKLHCWKNSDGARTPAFHPGR